MMLTNNASIRDVLLFPLQRPLAAGVRDDDEPAAESERGVAELVLETGRLRLRERRLDDLDFIAALNADPRVMRWIGDGATRERAVVEAHLARVVAQRAQRDPWDDFLLVERKADGVPLGQAGLLRCRIDGRPEVEIGWWLAPAAWGHGYATEAALALRDYAFATLRLDHLSIVLWPQNVRSVAVARRIGGELRGEVEYRGKRVTCYVVRAPAGRNFSA